jgi:hypothetical protein
MVKCGVPFEVQAEFLNIIKTSVGFKFHVIYKTIRNSKFRCLSEATPYYLNVFTFTLFLPKGRAGVDWEPSNKMMLFLPPRKIKSFTSPLDFLFEPTLHLTFPSLSVGFKGLTGTWTITFHDRFLKSVASAALVRKAADEIRFTAFFRSFGTKKVKDLVVTGNKLTNDFAGLVTSRGPPVG